MLKNLVFSIAIVACSLPASGAIIVQVQDTTISSGGTGFVDVFIRSTGTEDLYFSGYRFQITDSPNVLGELDFQSTQSDSETAVVGPPAYVFGNTATGNFAATKSAPFVLDGGDFLNSLPAISLTTTNQLLARLEIQHTEASPFSVPSTFTIALINDPLFTEFWSDDVGTLSTIDGSSFLSSNFGTITVTAAAVPEPGTFAVFSFAAACFGGHRLRRRRSASANSDNIPVS